MSAYSESGDFLTASVFAEAACLYRSMALKPWVMDYAALGCGGGMALCWARRLRICTVAAMRNSSRAPVRPRKRSLTRERICLASPKSLSIFLRSVLETP